MISDKTPITGTIELTLKLNTYETTLQVEAKKDLLSDVGTLLQREVYELLRIAAEETQK